MIIQSPYDDVELAPIPLHDFVLEGAAGRGLPGGHHRRDHRPGA